MRASTRERRRAHVVLAEDLVKEIDARVGQRQRSQFIAEAIEEKLRRIRRVEAFERILASTEEVSIPEWGTRESASDWVTGLRREWDRAASPESVDS